VNISSGSPYKPSPGSLTSGQTGKQGSVNQSPSVFM